MGQRTRDDRRDVEHDGARRNEPGAAQGKAHGAAQDARDSQAAGADATRDATRSSARDATPPEVDALAAHLDASALARSARSSHSGDVRGSDAHGDDVRAADVRGDRAAGDRATGDRATGDHAAGDRAAGDHLRDGDIHRVDAGRRERHDAGPAVEAAALGEMAAIAERLARYETPRRAAFDERMHRAIASWPAEECAAQRGVGHGAQNRAEPVAEALRLPVRSSGSRLLRRMALRTVGLAAAVVLSFGGLRAVSADSRPGDALWPVQRAVRSVERLMAATVEGLPPVLRGDGVLGWSAGRGPDAAGAGEGVVDVTEDGNGEGARGGEGSHNGPQDSHADGRSREPRATSVVRQGDRDAALDRSGASGPNAIAIRTHQGGTTVAGAAGAIATTRADADATEARIVMAQVAATNVAAATASAVRSELSPRTQEPPNDPERTQRPPDSGSDPGAGKSPEPRDTPSPVPPTPITPPVLTETPQAQTPDTPEPLTPPPGPPTIVTPIQPPPTPTGGPNQPPGGPGVPEPACRSSIGGRVQLPSGAFADRALVMLFRISPSEPPPAWPWPFPVPPPATNWPRQVPTNDEGVYVFESLCEGDYLVYAEALGPGGPLHGIHQRTASEPWLRITGLETELRGIDVPLQSVPTPMPPAGPVPSATPRGSGGLPPGGPTPPEPPGIGLPAPATATPTATVEP